MESGRLIAPSNNTNVNGVLTRSIFDGSTRPASTSRSRSDRDHRSRTRRTIFARNVARLRTDRRCTSRCTFSRRLAGGIVGRWAVRERFTATLDKIPRLAGDMLARGGKSGLSSSRESVSPGRRSLGVHRGLYRTRTVFPPRYSRWVRIVPISGGDRGLGVGRYLPQKRDSHLALRSVRTHSPIHSTIENSKPTRKLSTCCTPNTRARRVKYQLIMGNHYIPVSRSMQ